MGYYQSRLRYDSRRDQTWKEICIYLQRFIPKQSTVLDLGAGYCNFINNIKAGKKFAVDIAPEVNQYAGKKVTSLCRDATSLRPIKTGTIDVVFASNFLEHIPRDKMHSSLREIFRVLKTKGKLILIQPNFHYSFREYFDDYTHLQIFTHVSLPDVLKNSGFKTLIIKKKFLPFSMKNNFPVYRILVWLYLRLPLKPLAGQMLIISKKE